MNIPFYIKFVSTFEYVCSSNASMYYISKDKPKMKWWWGWLFFVRDWMIKNYEMNLVKWLVLYPLVCIQIINSGIEGEK